MNEEKRPDLHPQDYALRLFGRKNLFPWLLVFACMIAGALLGALLSLALPPVYEARALVSTNLELVQDANITEIMLDAEINHIGELVFHPEVVSALIEKEASLGNALTLEQLKKITSVERQLMNTVIKVRDQNPEVAARIASEWAEILYTRLTHSLRTRGSAFQREIAVQQHPRLPERAAKSAPIFLQHFDCGEHPR